MPRWVSTEEMLVIALTSPSAATALAVAMAARRYSQRHRDRIALMKCMGASQPVIFRSNLVQLLILALAGGVLGAVLGYLAQWGLAWLMRDLIGQNLPQPGSQPAALGLVTALAILAGFMTRPVALLLAGGCSGLHFFVVGLALAALYGYLYYSRWSQRLKLLAVAAETYERIEGDD